MGGAGSVDSEVAADGIDRDLCHLAKGAPLATGDGEETLHPVPLAVVEEGIGPGDVAGVGGGFHLVERPHTGPGPEDPG